MKLRGFESKEINEILTKLGFSIKSTGKKFEAFLPYKGGRMHAIWYDDHAKIVTMYIHYDDQEHRSDGVREPYNFYKDLLDPIVSKFFHSFLEELEEEFNFDFDSPNIVKIYSNNLREIKKWLIKSNFHLNEKMGCLIAEKRIDEINSRLIAFYRYNNTGCYLQTLKNGIRHIDDAFMILYKLSFNETKLHIREENKFNKFISELKRLEVKTHLESAKIEKMEAIQIKIHALNTLSEKIFDMINDNGNVALEDLKTVVTWQVVKDFINERIPVTNKNIKEKRRHNLDVIKPVLKYKITNEALYTPSKGDIIILLYELGYESLIKGFYQVSGRRGR